MSSSSTSHLPSFLLTAPPPVPPPSKLRLEALYASTSSQRLSNPTGYASNVAWWSEVLTETLRSGWLNGLGSGADGEMDPTRGTASAVGEHVKGKAKSGDRLLLRADDGMLSRLAGGAGERPKGLGGVLEDQSTRNPPIFHPLPHFLSSPAPLHAPPSLTYRIVGRPLSWAIHQVNPFASDQPKVEKEEALWKRYGAGKEYVCMPLLEQSAALFTAWLKDNPMVSYSDALFFPASFQRKFGSAVFPRGVRKPPEGKHELSQKDCEVLLKWLERDCRALVREGDVIKILQPGQTAADSPIVESDRGTLILLETLSKIDGQIDQLSAQISAFQTKAKSALSSNQRPLALSFLRSKKSAEEILSKRLATQDQLRAVLRSINQASDDIELMEAYEAASGVLGEMRRDPRLDMEWVDKTLEGLAEAMEGAEEVGRAVRDGGKWAVSQGAEGQEVDEDELAKELGNMVLEEKQKGTVQERTKEGSKEGIKEESKAERVQAERVQAERVQAERVQAERVQAERVPKADVQQANLLDQAKGNEEKVQEEMERRLGALKNPQEEVKSSPRPEREKEVAE